MRKLPQYSPEDLTPTESRLNAFESRYVENRVQHRMPPRVAHAAAKRELKAQLRGRKTTGAEQSKMLEDVNSYERLEELPRIQKAMAELRTAHAYAGDISRREVMEGFKDAILIARQKGDPATMVAGWREVGKMCGYYEPTRTKIEVSMTGKVVLQQLQAMTDDELLKMVDQTPDVVEVEAREVDEDGDEGAD